jgi:hypothetical protein
LISAFSISSCRIVSGDEVYAQTKKELPDLPIVIVTGYPDSDMMERDSEIRAGDRAAQTHQSCRS